MLGWLSIAKLGVYKVRKFGHILLFLKTFMISVYTLFLDFDFVKNHQYITSTLVCLFGSLHTIGAACFTVSILQLGLDQMPDASSSNITSFIAWLIFSINAGVWISAILYKGHWLCLVNINAKYPTSSIQLWSLTPVLCV